MVMIPYTSFLSDVVVIVRSLIVGHGLAKRWITFVCVCVCACLMYVLFGREERKKKSGILLVHHSTSPEFNILSTPLSNAAESAVHVTALSSRPPKLRHPPSP